MVRNKEPTPNRKAKEGVGRGTSRASGEESRANPPHKPTVIERKLRPLLCSLDVTTRLIRVSIAPKARIFSDLEHCLTKGR